MAITKYDFLGTPVYSNTLAKEILLSSISVALERIDTESVNTFVYFKNALSAEEETVLGSIISAHNPYNIERETDAPTDLNNKTIIHETSKPLGTYTHFTSKGDDPTDPTDIGNGVPLEIKHNLGDDRIQELYADFNIKENPTYIHEGNFIWSGADFDTVTVEVVPKITVTSPSENTFFNPYGGIIVPAAGNGVIAVNPADMRLVEMTVEEASKKRQPGFWNADYNYETHAYENITAAPDGSGIYNMFYEEKILNRFVNKALFVDKGFILLQTADSAELGDGLRMKFTIETRGEDHVWKAAIIVTFHRLKTA